MALTLLAAAIAGADNGPWDDLTANVVEHNILYDLRTGYHQEGRPVLLNPYMSDELHLALRDSIAFDSDCYHNPFTVTLSEAASAAGR